MPLTKEKLDEVLGLQAAGAYDQVHGFLGILDSDSRKTLAEVCPELIWEGARISNDPNSFSYAIICSTSHALPMLGLGWTNHSTIHGFPPVTVVNTERFAENLTDLANWTTLESYFSLWDSKSELYHKPLIKIFTPERIIKLVAKDVKTPFYLARGLLKGPLKRIPRWAAGLAAYPNTVASQHGSLYAETNHIIWQAQRSKDGNAAASIAILWPNEAEHLATGRPGITELHKLRDWNPESQPCPLTEQTLEELTRWKNRSTLREWGITTALCTDVKKKLHRPLSELNGQSIQHTNYEFKVHGPFIYHEA